jgi:hypothetical protein
VQAAFRNRLHAGASSAFFLISACPGNPDRESPFLRC